MKKYSQIQKIISILMIFSLMIELTGCYSTRVISTSEMSVSDKYLIQVKNSTYYIDSIIISNGMLSGKMDFSERNYSNSNRMHIYLSSDTLLKITNDVISLPVNNISKIDQRVPDPGRTKILTFILIVVGIGIGVAAIAGIIALVKDAKYITSPPPNSSTGCFTNW